MISPSKISGSGSGNCVLKCRGLILRVTSAASGSNDLSLDQSGMSIQILLEPNVVIWHVFFYKVATLLFSLQPQNWEELSCGALSSRGFLPQRFPDPIICHALISYVSSFSLQPQKWEELSGGALSFWGFLRQRFPDPIICQALISYIYFFSLQPQKWEELSGGALSFWGFLRQRFPDPIICHALSAGDSFVSMIILKDF